MYIRSVTKKNTGLDKTYHYFRLVHGYKIGSKVRQQTLLNLGSLEECPVEKHKSLADRIEMILTGASSMFDQIDDSIESLAQHYASQIQSKGLFISKKRKASIGKEPEETYQEVNLETVEQTESREMGAEWLCKQAFDKLGLNTLFANRGLNEIQVSMAQMLLTAKMTHPSSELETESWLKENSGAMELYGEEDFSTTRYRLCQAGGLLYNHKESIEKELYTICTNLFTQRSKIVVYDLTNMYFEGQMKSSKQAQFGRSKEKRSDCRLIGLALAIDQQGFVRYSQILPGNISEPETLAQMLNEVKSKLNFNKEKPIVVMDAGISTEENLSLIKEKGYDYVSVSRIRPKDFDLSPENVVELHDNKGHKIEVQKITENQHSDCFLHIKSEQKALKENSMAQKLTQRFEDKLIALKEGLAIKGRVKKIIKIHESVGRLKHKYSKVAKLYDIKYTEDEAKDIVTQIEWTRKKDTTKSAGEYFLRYSKPELAETKIWELYNLTTEVESSFRCLKTDLNIRPIHHQKDQYIEAHIWLGIVAYQVVNYIRRTLKENNINYSWTTIVQKMKTQSCSQINMDAKGDKKIYLKLCTRPNQEVKKIYDALGFKDRPYVRKTKVVTQL
jgi:hypothetical protein